MKDVDKCGGYYSKFALDCDGNRVTEGDRIQFSYGIPPVSVTAKVIEIDGKLMAIVRGHTPRFCFLKKLKKAVGEWRKV